MIRFSSAGGGGHGEETRQGSASGGQTGRPPSASPPDAVSTKASVARKLRQSSAAGAVVDYLNFTVAEMGEPDDHGWAPIHHAAQRGLLPALEKFITVNKQLLELKTGDTACTPLLVAVNTGSLVTVKALIELGARPDVVDAKNHGVVDICAFKRYMDILEYLAELNHDKLPAWKRLVKLLRSDFDEEVEAGSWCLQALTVGCNDEQQTIPGAGGEGEGTGANDDAKSVSETVLSSEEGGGGGKKMPKWKWALQAGIVPGISEVLRSERSDAIKLSTLRALLNLLGHLEIREQSISCGVVAALPQLVLSPNKEIIQLSAHVLKEIAGLKNFADDASKHGLVPALVEAMNLLNDDPAILAEVIDACGSITESSVTMRTVFGETAESVTTFARLYRDQSSRRVLVALSTSLAQIVNGHPANQRHFVDEGVLMSLMSLTRIAQTNVQLSAVEAIRALLDNNSYTQDCFIKTDQAAMLLKAVGRQSHQTVRDTAARALWIVASFNIEERRKIAELMGVQLFIEFLGTDSLNFHLIGAEGLEVLARSPHIKLSTDEQASAMQALVRLLDRCDKPSLVNILRAVRSLCVAVGYVPRTHNQTTLLKVDGIVTLMSLIAQSESNTLVQVEAMHTLACATLGNREMLNEIHQATHVMFAHARHLLNDADPAIRLHTGSALAAFTYNNSAHQKVISSFGGLRFHAFNSFLTSENQYFRCTAAFQVVVLAPMFVDEQPVLACAAGIKILVDSLKNSRSDVIKALTTDCIARLARSRAGVPAALISVSSIDLLCDLLLSQSYEQVRGSAALALGYLSFNHKAMRELLNRCRLSPSLVTIVRYYASDGKLSPDFDEEWKHYTRIGLPNTSKQAAT